MSDIAVTIERISELVPHPNASRLEIAKILGTQTLVPKEQYKVGDTVIYFPPDICLPADWSLKLGVQQYLKHALCKGENITCRVAACRLRGIPSYGFIAPLDVIPGAILSTDVTDVFGAWKYEPPVRIGRQCSDAEQEPGCFHHYTDIQNFWKYYQAFIEGQMVRITEKIHGSNSRVGLLQVNNEWRFYAGSHKTAKKRVADGKENVYWLPIQLPGVMELLTEVCGEINNVILFGELYGPGVQDLDYGVPAGEIAWRVYDMSINGQYVNWNMLVTTCLACGVQTVPVLYTGPFSAALVDEFTNGSTHMAKTESLKSKFKGREGIVITPLVEAYSDIIGGRLILKSVSADYRDRKGAKDEVEL